MNFAVLALTAALSFGFFALVFRPLELVFPARPGQRFFRPDWFTDLCFFLGQYLLWSGLVLWCSCGSRPGSTGMSCPTEFPARRRRATVVASGR